jgi:hypothetical protein
MRLIGRARERIGIGHGGRSSEGRVDERWLHIRCLRRIIGAKDGLERTSVRVRRRLEWLMLSKLEVGSSSSSSSLLSERFLSTLVRIPSPSVSTSVRTGTERVPKHLSVLLVSLPGSSLLSDEPLLSVASTSWSSLVPPPSGERRKTKDDGGQSNNQRDGPRWGTRRCR